MTTPNEKTVEETVRAQTWRIFKEDPLNAYISQKQFTEAITSLQQSALEEKKAMVNTVLGWREKDWPEGFDRKTAQMIADNFEKRHNIKI